MKASTDWREFATGVWWIFVAPLFVYLLINHFWHINHENREFVAGTLTLVGGLIYFLPRG